MILVFFFFSCLYCVCYVSLSCVFTVFSCCLIVLRVCALSCFLAHPMCTVCVLSIASLSSMFTALSCCCCVLKSVCVLCCFFVFFACCCVHLSCFILRFLPWAYYTVFCCCCTVCVLCCVVSLLSVHNILYCVVSLSCVHTLLCWVVMFSLPCVHTILCCHVSSSCVHTIRLSHCYFVSCVFRWAGRLQHPWGAARAGAVPVAVGEQLWVHSQHAGRPPAAWAHAPPSLWCLHGHVPVTQRYDVQMIFCTAGAFCLMSTWS